jgi:PAS domain S-box-containing protein
MMDQRTVDILESITEAFVTLDREWRFTYINGRALRRIRSAKGGGLTREDLLGKNFWEEFPVAVGTTIYDKYHEAMRGQETVRYETHFPPNDAWYEVNIYPSEEGLSVYSRDITERKQADEQLRYHAYLLENTEDAVLASDEHAVLTAWNKGAEKMFGWRAEEVLGREVYEVIPYRDYSDEQLEEALRKLAETGRRRTEATWYRKDGAPVYAEALTIALRGEEGGEISGYLSIMRDISERKLAEQEIERRTHQQAVVAELGLRAVANDDLQDLIDEATALVARTLEVEYSKIVELLPGREELLLRAGVGWREGLVGEAKERASLGSQAGYTTLVSNEAVIVEDLREERRFQPPPLLVEHGVVSSMTVVIPGSEGPFGVLGVHTTTHRTFSEDDINFLQAVANVLATAIEREESQQRLEEVREAERSRIARDLHDEALQGLSGAMADTQIARTRPEETTKRLEEISEALRRVERQVRTAIYDLGLEGERERSFPELLEVLLDLHRSMAPELDISLDLNDGVLDGPLEKVGKELLRIIGEALTNARRHSGARSVQVSVTTHEGKLVAEVQDDGRGIEEAEESSAGALGGMGTRGMRERARVLGGDLRIESDQESGTRVRFEMSLKKEDEEAEDEAVRVLLVDDHATIREALASSFEREGFEVVGQAGSMAEARKLLEEVEQPADVALIDLGLPDGYGADLIKELREAHPQAQALVLSASLDRANLARAVEAGAAGVLSKTAHLDEVVDGVKRLRRGETLMPLEEVVELLRYSSSKREEEHEAHQAIEKLTPREIEVLKALAMGLDSEGIAAKMNIALRTERNHMASILKKLGVHSQLQALVFALRHGVVEIP